MDFNPGKTMKKVIMLMAVAALMASCGKSSEKMKQQAKENLELSVDYPKQLQVMAVSEPDSAFGTGYFNQNEVMGMMQTMKVVTDTIMRRTGNMSRFNPADHYVVSLAERQVRNTQTGEMMTVPAKKRIRFKPSGSITHYTLKYGL